MSSILKVDTIQDANGNAIISSDGSGNLTPNTFTALTVSGDLTVDTDTLYVDSTNNRVGIGTTSPTRNLHLVSGASTNLELERTAVGSESKLVLSSATSFNAIYSRDGASSDKDLVIHTGSTERMSIKGTTVVVNDSSNDVDFRVETNTNTHGLFVDAGGNTVVIGKTALDNSTAGYGFGIGSYASFVTNGTRTLLLNRLTSTGEIINFRSSNSEIGSIGVINTDNFYISGEAANHAGIQFGTNAVSPMVAGAGVSGVVSLGSSSDKFKDVWISGKITNADGTGGLSVDGSGHVVLNEDSYDRDFRVESNANTHALYVDGGDSSVYVGKSDGNFNTAGIRLNVAGLGYSQFTRSSGQPLTLNRTTDNGDILGLYYGGIKIGQLGVMSNDNFVILNPHVNTSKGIGIADDNLYPTAGDGNSSNGAMDIGDSSAKFRNAYFSGTVNAGKAIITEASSGATADASGDTLIIENNTHGGMSIFGGTNDSSRIYFGTSAEPTRGLIYYNHPSNYMRLDAAGLPKMQLSSSEVVVNEGSYDLDFRVESDTNTHALFVDAGNDRVGVGTNNPKNTLHVKGDFRQGEDTANDMVLQDNNDNFADNTATDLFTLTAPDPIFSYGRLYIEVVVTNGGTASGYAMAISVREILWSRYGGNMNIIENNEIRNNSGTINATLINETLTTSASVTGDTLTVSATAVVGGSTGAPNHKIYYKVKCASIRTDNTLVSNL